MTSPTLPTLSIVVPNFNGGKTLGRTLQSLLDQDYPGLEIFVADGGSTDESVEVLRRFEPHLHGWLSEADTGQSQALNRGFARTTGEIVNWLCSDDLLEPGALHRVGRFFTQHAEVDVLVGTCLFEFLDEQGNVQRTHEHRPTLDGIDTMPCGNPIPQPSCFYRRRLLEGRALPIDESYRYAMDFELWNYFKSQGARWHVIDDRLSRFPFDGANKTSTGGDKIIAELERIYRAYTDERMPLSTWHRWLRLPLERFRKRHPGRGGYLVARPLQLALTLGLGPFYGLRRVRAMNWHAFAS